MDKTLPVQFASIAAQVACTEAEGPGQRYALWFQGCPLRCPGCCNPEYLPFEGGQKVSVLAIQEQIAQSQRQHSIEGVTLLGGEPFAHTHTAVPLAQFAQQSDLSVMIFTGYTLEQLHAQDRPDVTELLELTDILVDGPFQRDQPDTHRRWIGSTNQRIHFLTPRYQADDPCWQEQNTLEIRVRGADISINGFPGADAKGIWKGWKRKAQS